MKAHILLTLLQPILYATLTSPIFANNHIITQEIIHVQNAHVNSTQHL